MNVGDYAASADAQELSERLLRAATDVRSAGRKGNSRRASRLPDSSEFQPRSESVTKGLFWLLVAASIYAETNPSKEREPDPGEPGV